MEMFISFFTGKVMLFYGISLIMKEKSNASALLPRSLTTIGKGLLGKQIVVFFLENPFMTCIYETVYFV